MLSIIVPSYKEPYLKQAVGSLLDSAESEIELFVILDGYNLEESLSSDPRLKIIELPENKGMRAAVNAGLARATGEYLMKADSHCLFGRGYDKVLTANCAENWLVTPRRCPLRPETWEIAGPGFIDYEFLCSPTLSSGYGHGIFPIKWPERTEERKDKPEYEIDDTMTMQGSCWVANREYFMDHVGFLDDNPATYNTFTGEPLEVGLKYWLGGGEMKVNKRTWYAHLFKSPRFYRQFTELRAPKRAMHSRVNHEWGARHWIRNEEPNMIHKFEWLIEKFWPVPTWPDDWKEEVDKIYGKG